MASSYAVAALLLAAQAVTAPGWLETYGGVTARVRTTPGIIEAAYETEAAAAEVIAHYRKLFEGAGIAFQPNFDGTGTVIRGAAPEGELLIQIRREPRITTVRVYVSARAQQQQPAAPRATPAPEIARTPAPRAQSGREHVRNMEKYDQPVRPAPRPAAPALAWPVWLTATDGTPLEFEKGRDRVGLKTASATYVAAAERNAVQAFYAELLAAHGFTVRSQSMASWPAKLKGWIEASDRPITEGRVEIRIEAAPQGETTRVEIRMTARP